jgi:phage/plasmid-associated DNA primase
MKLAEFLKWMFGASTQHPIFVTSLPNNRNEGYPKHVLTRHPDHINSFAKKWDTTGRGLFFCVSTLKPGSAQRSKATISELTCLHVDIDFKDVKQTPEWIEQTLLEHKIIPPSLINRTGNGLHCYWLFKEGLEATPENIDRHETALGQIADIFGGDFSCVDSARLMRLPGSHNSKDGAWKEVEVLRSIDHRYELDELEEALGFLSPIIHHLIPADSPAPTDPYSAYAEIASQFGYKAPIDIEQRLSAMSYQGVGDTSIHSTQISVSAALLNRGVPTDEVVQTILAATRAAAGQHGDRWNWKREERALRRMCNVWIEKHPEVMEARAAAQAEAAAVDTETQFSSTEQMAAAGGGGGAKVYDIGEERQSRGKDKKTSSKTKDDEVPQHVVIGEAVLGVLKKQGIQLLFTVDGLWRYQEGLWTNIQEQKQWLNWEIQKAVEALADQGFKSNNRLINETREWIARKPELGREQVQWDSHGGIPTESGLIKISSAVDSSSSYVVEPLAPEHYATWRLECPYLPQDASCPHWLQMLDDFFGDRPGPVRAEIIGLVQEIFGCALVEDKSRALTRALVLQGPSESGKSQVIEVLSRMISDTAILAPFDSLNSSHGLMPFLKRAPWVLHEAFEQSQWHLSSVVKTILTGEPVQINIKNGPMVYKRIKVPVFWGTNHPPSFKEMSKAMVNRLQIIKCGVVFDHNNPIGVAREAYTNGFSSPAEFILSKERSGILNWGIEGFKRALKRGFLPIVADVEEAMEEFRDQSNFVTAFVKDQCEYDPSNIVSTNDFCVAFSVWWQEEHGENNGTPSNYRIGKAMSALSDPLIAVDRTELRDNTYRYYAGIKLKESALDYWLAAVSEDLARGKTTHVSQSVDVVNKRLPGAWLDRPSVQQMLRAHKAKKGVTDQVTDRSPVTDDRSLK